ncbi:hypothetical protein EYV94_05035 [Puteibacter caeruleilacunae]|nr:hypothetical protein EYV94_05035 [Puteibacter caeruleilacunae]
MIKNFIGMVFLLLMAIACQRTNKNDISFVDQKIDGEIDRIVNALPEITFPDRTINLIEYAGFEPDSEGTKDFQPVLNKAIKELAAKGGGTIYFPHTWGSRKWVKGTDVYRMDGPINLASNIRLMLAHGTKIQFTFNPVNYLDNGKGVITRWEGVSIKSFSPLIRAFNAENVAIVGEGKGAMPIIDGDGEKWQHWSTTQDPQLDHKYVLHRLSDEDVKLTDREFVDVNKDFYRPYLLEFYLCKNILIDGVQLFNTPFWTVHPVFSENVTVRNVIFNVQAENSDGVDPESTHNVLIERCVFNNHDDNVAIKSGRNKEGREGIDISGTEIEKINSPFIHGNKMFGATENVVVRNCIMKGHHAICIGSEVAGSVRNVYAVDNVGVQDVKYGLFIKSSPKRGGMVENIYVRNMKLHKASMAVVLNPCYAKQDTVSTHYPLFRNIYVKDMEVDYAENGGVEILGWSKLPIKGVHLENVTIKELNPKKRANPVKVINATQINFKNVQIEGEKFNGDYSDESGEKPRSRT